MKPVITEIYPGTQESASFAVAVVKTNSGINRLEDLRDKRSCHTGFGRTAGKLKLTCITSRIIQLIETIIRRLEYPHLRPDGTPTDKPSTVSFRSSCWSIF